MKKFLKQIRGNIVTGVLLLIPSVTTIYVFIKLFGLVDSILPNLFHIIFPFLPKNWIPGFGAVLIILISYFVGLGAKNYFGKLILDTGNALIAKIPLINKIYMGIQQIVDTFSGQKKNLFEKVVLVQYPKKDSYCIGFVTSYSTGEIEKKINSEMVSVFIPTTPNPTSGFLLYLPTSEVIVLEMNVETAIKAIMSAGVVNSDHLKRTNHMYTMPQELKNFNWLRMFRHGRKGPHVDPLD
ncbi:MAG: DUF502 domain-containing protein [Candidatus Aminicenantes bacterium]|nr:DUF502 domain-containing protein [Candidatus Aminicenantes bacterium]